MAEGKCESINAQAELSRSTSTIESRSSTNIPVVPDLEGARQKIIRTESTNPIVIPRAQRRGLLARFALLPEVEVATTISRREKWLITFIVAMCGVVGPFSSGITLPALTPISQALNCSTFIVSMSIALYMLAMAIFPLWWSSFSEKIGRRSVYIVSNTLLILFSVLSAVSNTAGMFLAMRFFTGSAASAALSVGAGTIADIWEPKERGQAMGYFFLGPLCGPLIAPVVGGGLTLWLGWRSTLWFLAIYGTVILVLVIFCLPETSKVKPIVAASPQLEKTEETTIELRSSIRTTVVVVITTFDRFLIEPLKVLTYLKFPAVALTVYFQSVSFGALYLLNISLESTFSHSPYSFPSWVVGFVYAPSSIGFVVTSILGGPWMDRIMRREAIKANRYDGQGWLIYLPEDRMRENAWIGVIMYPLAMIWFGWAVQEDLMWVGALVPPFFFGIGSFLVFSVSTTMLTEFMPGRSASGVAIVNFFRNIFSFVGALVATPWINAMGNGWVMTIIGIWALSSAVVIWLIRRYGAKWRKEMDAALSS